MKKNIFYFRQIFFSMLLALLITSNTSAAEPIVAPGSGATKVYSAPNGVPVVDINTANKQGLSHNTFIEYNVGPQGLILNNANTDIIVRQSQLAGQIVANKNLDKEAKFILNEVVTSNRTRLEGFTEVLGGKADVIIANPFGITAEGCGFINTNAIVLSTGKPNFGPLPQGYLVPSISWSNRDKILKYEFTGLPDNQPGGMLNGFEVLKGDILIQGKGINASEASILKLIAHSLKIDGQINAGDNMSIVAGNNQLLYDYQIGWMEKIEYSHPDDKEHLDWGWKDIHTKRLEAIEDSPVYAIDSTVFGGLYAGAIHIISTEKGVGVRMLGKAAATSGDFFLTSDGNIEIKSDISSLSPVMPPKEALSNTELGWKIYSKHSIGIYSSSGYRIQQSLLMPSYPTPYPYLSMIGTRNEVLDVTDKMYIYQNLTDNSINITSAKLTATNNISIYTKGEVSINNSTLHMWNGALSSSLSSGFNIDGTSELLAGSSEFYNAAVYEGEKYQGKRANNWINWWANSVINLNSFGDIVNQGAMKAESYIQIWSDKTVKNRGQMHSNLVNIGGAEFVNEASGSIIALQRLRLVDVGLWKPTNTKNFGIMSAPKFEAGGDGEFTSKKEEGATIYFDDELEFTDSRDYCEAFHTCSNKFAIFIDDKEYDRYSGGPPADGPPLSFDVGVEDGFPLPLEGKADSPPVPSNLKYIMAPEHETNYLIEANPLFSLGADYIGLQYMEPRYGYNPLETVKRLENSDYEAYLIRRQLMDKTGSGLLKDYADEAAQIKALIEAGVSSKKELGLEYGKALTGNQLALLKKDIVWMVKTEVDGQKVLAPVVYLAKSTRTSMKTGIIDK